MTRKILVVVLALLLVIGMTGSALAAEQKPIQLSLAHIWPATHVMETLVVQGWIKAVEKATNGRVKINSYPAGVLLPSQEIYDGVVKGVADIGLSAYAYNRGRFPVIETFLLPGVSFNNSTAASLALMEGISILKPKELQDTQHLFSIATGPGDLMTTKKPVKELEDLRGLQIGATAGLRSDAVQMLGATPVVMPMPEWYEALNKGVMDGGIAPVETLKGFKLGEVTGNYITLTPFLYNQAFFAVMNKAKWNSLPPDIQKAITKATQEFYKKTIPGLWDQINKSGLKWAREKKSIQIITLSKEETARWVNKTRPLQWKYVALLKQKGLPGDKILNTVKNLANKYNKQYPAVAPYIK